MPPAMTARCFVVGIGSFAAALHTWSVIYTVQTCSKGLPWPELCKCLLVFHSVTAGVSFVHATLVLVDRWARLLMTFLVFVTTLFLVTVVSLALVEFSPLGAFYSSLDPPQHGTFYWQLAFVAGDLFHLLLIWTHLTWKVSRLDCQWRDLVVEINLHVSPAPLTEGQRQALAIDVGEHNNICALFLSRSEKWQPVCSAKSTSPYVCVPQPFAATAPSTSSINDTVPRPLQTIELTDEKQSLCHNKPLQEDQKHAGEKGQPDAECCICLVAFEPNVSDILRLECGHQLFHTTCIAHEVLTCLASERRIRCPLCRFPIRLAFFRFSSLIP